MKTKTFLAVVNAPLRAMLWACLGMLLASCSGAKHFYVAKLERFEWELEQRTRVAARYDALLSGRIGKVAPMKERTRAYAQYTVVVEERERIQAALQAAGIPTAVHYPVPIHRQPAYAHLSYPDWCPVAVEMASKVISLPMGPYLSPESAHTVAATLLRAAGVALPGGVDAAGVAEAPGMAAATSV